jgi:hypothetical protein
MTLFQSLAGEIDTARDGNIGLRHSLEDYASIGFQPVSGCATGSTLKIMPASKPLKPPADICNDQSSSSSGPFFGWYANASETHAACL